MMNERMIKLRRSPRPQHGSGGHDQTKAGGMVWHGGWVAGSKHGRYLRWRAMYRTRDGGRESRLGRGCKVGSGLCSGLHVDGWSGLRVGACQSEGCRGRKFFDREEERWAVGVMKKKLTMNRQGQSRRNVEQAINNKR